MDEFEMLDKDEDATFSAANVVGLLSISYACRAC